MTDTTNTIAYTASDLASFQHNQECVGGFDLSQTNDSTFMQQAAAEALNIAGAPVNVFKLLGIKEQGKLTDVTGNGSAISSGEVTTFPAANAFDSTFSEWRSVQRGCMVTTSCYIGYDFGVIKLDNDRNRYGIDAPVRKMISAIKIRQGCDEKQRVTKARIERSDDGTHWFGVAIIQLPNNNQEVLVEFKRTAPSRMWRIVPLVFTGDSTDYWSVISVDMYDYTSTKLDSVQDDFGMLENRDRQYATSSVQVKASIEISEANSYLSALGIDQSTTQQYRLQVSFLSCVSILGRPIVIGDILELPSEAQYSPTMQQVKKYLEVNDVAWASNGYTPGWKPIIQQITAVPMIASQETQDIVGDLDPASSDNFFANLDQENYNITAVVSDIRAHAEASSQFPEYGADTSDIRVFTDDELKKAESVGVNISQLQINQKALFLEDGLPPNGLAYTEGEKWPANPKDGDYHRLTYAETTDIPPRLYQFSIAKNRWVFLEEDQRYKYRKQRSLTAQYLSDNNTVSASIIGK